MATDREKDNAERALGRMVKAAEDWLATSQYKSDVVSVVRFLFSLLKRISELTAKCSELEAERDEARVLFCEESAPMADLYPHEVATDRRWKGIYEEQ